MPRLDSTDLASNDIPNRKVQKWTWNGPKGNGCENECAACSVIQCEYMCVCVCMLAGLANRSWLVATKTANRLTVGTDRTTEHNTTEGLGIVSAALSSLGLRSVTLVCNSCQHTDSGASGSNSIRIGPTPRLRSPSDTLYGTMDMDVILVCASAAVPTLLVARVARAQV